MATRTTSATGDRRTLRRAFTLVEVLIVIALIGAVTALVVTDFFSLVDTASKPSALESLREAVDAGREAARAGGSPARLVWIPETGALRLLAHDATKDFPIPGAQGVTFAFINADDKSRLRMEALVFHPSGIALPALIDLSVDGTHTRYEMEPFSAALVPEAAP